MKKYILIGVFFFVVSAFVMLPAGLAAKLLPENITANHYQGSVWSGTANALTIDGTSLGIVQWRVNPMCFLLLKLCVDVEQSNHDLQSSFTLKVRRSTEVENLLASGEAKVLNPFVQNMGVELSGQFDADLAHFSYREANLEKLDGDVKFTRLALNGVVQILLGNIQAHFQPQAEHTELDISNSAGHLELSATGQLFIDLSYDLDVRMEKNDLSTDIIIHSLDYIGEKQPDGSVFLQRSGKLSI